MPRTESFRDNFVESLDFDFVESLISICSRALILILWSYFRIREYERKEFENICGEEVKWGYLQAWGECNARQFSTVLLVVGGVFCKEKKYRNHLQRIFQPMDGVVEKLQKFRWQERGHACACTCWPPRTLGLILDCWWTIQGSAQFAFSWVESRHLLNTCQASWR